MLDDTKVKLLNKPTRAIAAATCTATSTATVMPASVSTPVATALSSSTVSSATTSSTTTPSIISSTVAPSTIIPSTIPSATPVTITATTSATTASAKTKADTVVKVAPTLTGYNRHRERFGDKRIIDSTEQLDLAATNLVINNNDAQSISFATLVNDIELYQYLNASKNVKDFHQRISLLLNSIGVGDFAHTSMRSMSGVLDPFGTYDPKTTDQYAKEGFHIDDMTVRALMRDKRPIFRAVVDDYVARAPFDTEFLARHREARKFLQQQGMHDVYNIPILQNNEVASLFSMSTHGCDPLEFQAKIAPYTKRIQFLAKAVDNIGTQKFNTHFHNEKFNPRLPLHLKPLLLLETLAQKGCTLNEAAEILDIAISTANQHIAAAKKAFGVSTTQGAILAALKERLIHLE